MSITSFRKCLPNTTIVYSLHIYTTKLNIIKKPGSATLPVYLRLVLQTVVKNLTWLPLDIETVQHLLRVEIQLLCSLENVYTCVNIMYTPRLVHFNRSLSYVELFNASPNMVTTVSLSMQLI